jgi:putative transposase
MQFVPLLADTWRKKRRSAVGPSWSVDESDIKVQEHWCYRYRVIDRDGNLPDARLRNTRDLTATEAFFRSPWRVTGVVPARITTDGHDGYPRAIRAVFGDQVTHGTNCYLNNHLEQDYRGIKQRYRPTSGLRTFRMAAQFCRVFGEVRGFLQPQSCHNQRLSLIQQRAIHVSNLAIVARVLTYPINPKMDMIRHRPEDTKTRKGCLNPLTKELTQVLKMSTILFI